MNKPTTPRNGVWQKILDLMFDNLNTVVNNDEFIKATGQHNYARRIRELRAEGWQIQYSTKDKGYILTSAEKVEKVVGDYVNLRLRTEVLERDNYTCQLCGYGKDDVYSDGEKVRLEADHIIPLAIGGKTEVENLQTLCARCNAGKKSKIAYSVIDEDMVSMVIRIPKELEQKLQEQASSRSISVKDLIVDMVRNNL